MKQYPLPSPQMIIAHYRAVLVNNAVYADEQWQKGMEKLFKIFSDTADALNRIVDEFEKGNKDEDK